MYQTEQPNPEVNPSAMLTNFSDFTDTALAYLAQSQNWHMTASDLSVCREFFRSIRRDPTIDELNMLDTVVTAAHQDPECFLLAEMITKDETVAETFSDLMTRRSQQQISDPAPLSLADIAVLMENWLELHHRTDAPKTEVALRFSRYRDLLLLSDGYRRTAASGKSEDDVAIGVPDVPRENEAKANDYMYVLFADEPESFSRISALLQEGIGRKLIHSITPTMDKTLLGTILSMNCGATLYSEYFSAGISPFSALSTRVQGTIVTIAPTHSDDLQLLSEECGIRYAFLGTVAKTPKELIIQDQNAFLIYPLTFFRSLQSHYLCQIEMNAVDAGSFDVSLSRLGSCTLSKVRHAVAKVKATGDAPFLAGLFGVIHALSHCIAAGASVTDTRLALSLALTTRSATSLGESLSLLLGVYRAQAEFALHGNMPYLFATSETHPSVGAVTLAPIADNAPSTIAVGGDTKIFYLEPLYHKNGLPDFDDLKKMYAYVEALIKDDKILAIRPTGNDLLSDLNKMCANITVEFLADLEMTPRFGGFLVETNEDIEGILVAKSENPDKSNADT